MSKLIRTWDELYDIKSKDNKFIIVPDEDGYAAWIQPIKETKETLNELFWDTHEYLSTHTFYGSQYKNSTKILQRFGFDVEIDNWDKEN